jgi:hypothetical protein
MADALSDLSQRSDLMHHIFPTTFPIRMTTSTAEGAFGQFLPTALGAPQSTLLYISLPSNSLRQPVSLNDTMMLAR